MPDQVLEPDFVTHLQFARLQRGVMIDFSVVFLDDMPVSELDLMDTIDIDDEEIR